VEDLETVAAAPGAFISPDRDSERLTVSAAA
jgi:hypothetical protein